jgi:hypothetical protein
MYCRPKQFYCRPRPAAQLLPISPDERALSAQAAVVERVLAAWPANYTYALHAARRCAAAHSAGAARQPATGTAAACVW